jgi:long-subunit fatty acid transport protein
MKKLSHTRRGRDLLAALLAASAAASALAQDPQTAPPTFEFSFSNPGARSMGFGGAFAALADDATAAFANPAGLVQLVEPEVSIEGRGWSYSTPYAAGGRLFGEPTGVGLDSTPGLRTDRSSESVSGLSFLSVVYPKGDWSFAFYRHQLASFEFRGVLEGLYSGPYPGITFVRREFDQRKTTDLDITSYAVSVAWQVTETLSVGAGVAYFEGTMAARAESYGHVCGGPVAPPCSPEALSTFFSARPMVPEDLALTTNYTLDDTDAGLVAGFLWSFAERWKLGGSFREGPALSGRSGDLTGPASVGVPPGTLIDGGPLRIKFPDVFGLGLSYRTPGQRVTVSVEWDRVEYSDIVGAARGEGFLLDDGDELHLGGEYVFLGSSPIVALRLGLWRDPDHQLRYRGENYVAAGVLRAGDAELHAAAGLGVKLERLQLDLGVDLSDLLDTVSLSTIYRF